MLITLHSISSSFNFNETRRMTGRNFHVLILWKGCYCKIPKQKCSEWFSSLLWLISKNVPQ